MLSCQMGDFLVLEMDCTLSTHEETRTLAPICGLHQKATLIAITECYCPPNRTENVGVPFHSLVESQLTHLDTSAKLLAINTP